MCSRRAQFANGSIGAKYQKVLTLAWSEELKGWVSGVSGQSASSSWLDQKEKLGRDRRIRFIAKNSSAIIILREFIRTCERPNQTKARVVGWCREWNSGQKWRRRKRQLIFFESLSTANSPSASRFLMVTGLRPDFLITIHNNFFVFY